MTPTHASPQLTPAQLVDAGRRAEAEGRADLAVRFYGHLTRHFAETAEAAEAHGALGRIEARQADSAVWPPTPLVRSERRPTPEPERYAAGRALARALGVIGWMLALTGAVGLPAYMLLRAGPAALSHAVLVPLGGGAAGSLILGLGLMLAAQVARAQFDQADAARDLVALERVRLGHDLDPGGRKPGTPAIAPAPCT
jgi:hypothetical protein